MMTHVDNAPAGPELNRFIAERVMEWTWVTGSDVTMTLPFWSTADVDRDATWSPSTNIAHAWEVVEKRWPGEFGLMRNPAGQWVAGRLGCTDNGVLYIDDGDAGYADTAPLAICRAAAKAVIR